MVEFDKRTARQPRFGGTTSAQRASRRQKSLHLSRSSSTAGARRARRRQNSLHRKHSDGLVELDKRTAR
jgi:hypothetical protein